MTTPPDTAAEVAPELTDPVGLNGNSLMGIQPWPIPGAVNPLEPSPVTPPPAQTPAELRAQAEKLLAEADSLENTGM